MAVCVAVVLGVAGASAATAERLQPRIRDNLRCCQLSRLDAIRVALLEAFGWRRFHAEVGQDKWVLEHVFPGVRDGYFVDVGSGHGWIGSNTAALEARGWRGLCVDPFPAHMDGRTCTMLREVVFSESGRELAFHVAGGLGGLAATLGAWNTDGARAPVVRRRTVTLDELLARAEAPPFIHYVSIDIEGAELEALRGFPFDRHRVGAWTIEHNREEPKRSAMIALLAAHGYVRVHTWQQDDYFVARAAPR